MIYCVVTVLVGVLVGVNLLFGPPQDNQWGLRVLARRPRKATQPATRTHNDEINTTKLKLCKSMLPMMC